MKIEITEKAKEELKKALELRKDNKPLRIYVAAYG
ncbi:MAG: iron-sulfur cluster biosynthesis family protein [Thermoanaerobacteraceae bacterium]|nr:iron-sulfur cluster biosynthesis family protein [Tissierellia bacterium]NLZ53245.1 iron-sulfur cluster biosynthesis family protein [Thermoanaerobacteraceae bacterium]